MMRMRAENEVPMLLLFCVLMPCLVYCNPACTGTSPTGQRWLYLQPQHTGSGTVCSYLTHVLKHRTCVHGHFYLPPPHLDIKGVFAFGFVSNPYRRLLSSAMFHRILKPSLGDKNVPVFKKWIQSGMGTKEGARFHMFSVPLYVQSGMFQHFPMRFVGCTSQLDAHLQQVLKLLGYNITQVVFPHEQRFSSKLASSEKLAKMKWYDAAAEERVRYWYSRDFIAFNFSQSSSKMWDKEGCTVRRSFKWT